MTDTKIVLWPPGTVRPNVIDPKRRLISLVAKLTVAGTVGLAAGAVTERSFLHLPFNLEPLSNTAAPWVLVAFAVALIAPSMGESLMLSLVTLIALVVGFYVAQALRGWPVSREQFVFWSPISVIMGPLIGLAAGWIRHAGRTAGALAAGIIGGLLVGEALHGLTALKFSTSPNYWDVQLLLGCALAVALTVWRFRSHWPGCVRAVSMSMLVCTVVGLGTLAAYQIL